jgi:hypothetical protein
MARSARSWLYSAALFCAIAVAASTEARAQDCRPLVPDSDRVLAWVDSVAHRHLRARDLNLDYWTVAIPGSLGCSTAVAIAWAEGLGGALAILSPGGTLVSLDQYRFIADVRPAGPDRLAFRYRAGWATGYGRGTRDNRFSVLCSFGTTHWIECLNLEEAVDQETAPEWTAPDSSAGLYITQRADIRVVGDSVSVHRYVDWTIVYLGGALGPFRTQDLGSFWVRLP